jgi:hypothetical protein
MQNITPTLTKAFEIAAAFVGREVTIRLRLDPLTNPDEIWAAVTFDGRIFIGTPALHGGQGFYVDHNGNWMEA